MQNKSELEQELRALIRECGRITFARFMQVCLYSPRGGFYATRHERIGAHFGTSPTSHPVFGALIARQLEQMWHRLGAPPVFHVLEVGAGDGALARSIVSACRQLTLGFAQALRYIAADYEPQWTPSTGHRIDLDSRTAADEPDLSLKIQQVKASGLRAFRHVTGCILSNELIDNFPVHRFAIQNGSVKEVYVTLEGGKFTEVLDEPSTTGIAGRLADLSLSDGYRGEVNLAVEDWTRDVSRTLDRGYVLTIDYGLPAAELYAPENNQGRLICFHQHAVQQDPYQRIGQQDITCHVDFTALMRLGEQHGLTTAGYIPQRDFLINLGFADCLESPDSQGLSAARAAINRMAMMALVDPEQYGDLKVLVQAKGAALDGELLGFPRP